MAVVCRNTEPPAPVQRHPAVHQEVKVTVVTQNDNEAVVGKTQVKRDEQGNEINPDVPVTKLRDGDTIVVDTGAGMTADGGDSMPADEGM